MKKHYVGEPVFFLFPSASHMQIQVTLILTKSEEVHQLYI